MEKLFIAAAPHVPIPETFSEVQAETILAINKISATDWGFAQQLLQAWTPGRFTGSQAQCVHEMLQLGAEDMKATLADAMEPCALRQRLRSRRRLASHISARPTAVGGMQAG